MTVKIYSRYDEHPSVDAPASDPKKGALQSSKDECDINNIMRHYEKTRQVPPHLIREDGHYGDFTDIPSYQDSLNQVMRAKEQFDLLGSRIRERFDNDPQKFLDFVSKPENGAEMAKLGLFKPRPPVPPKESISEGVTKPAPAKKSKPPKEESDA